MLPFFLQSVRIHNGHELKCRNEGAWKKMKNCLCECVRALYLCVKGENIISASFQALSNVKPSYKLISHSLLYEKDEKK
jgi:hypothetical protein